MGSHDLKLQIAKYKSQTKTKSQTKNSKRMSTVELLLTWTDHIIYVGSFLSGKTCLGHWKLGIGYCLSFDIWCLGFIFCEVFK